MRNFIKYTLGLPVLVFMSIVYLIFILVEIVYNESFSDSQALYDLGKLWKPWRRND